MHIVVQSCILGVLTGGVYALMASGLTLVFGVMRVINVAQGALVILSAYLSYVLFKDLHVDPFLSVLIVAPFMFALGVAVQMVFIRSLRSEQAEELSLLITWALALGIEGTLGAIFQTTYRATNPGYANSSWTVFGYQVSVVRAYAFALSVAILVLLYLLLAKTRFGRSVRATVQNPRPVVPSPPNCSSGFRLNRSANFSSSPFARARDVRSASSDTCVYISVVAMLECPSRR